MLERTRLALQPFLKALLAHVTTLPSLPHTLRAARGVSYIIFIELSMQGTATRYCLFPDFNPRDDFQFSVLIHTVVKIFHIGDVQAGFGFFLWFSFKHMFLVPIQWKRRVACLCCSPVRPAVWLGLLNSMKWSADSMCHKGCLGRVKSKISARGWACVLITSPKSCNVQNLAGTCSKEK